MNERVGKELLCHGRKFPSIRSLARHYKMERATIKQRMRRGLTVEEAVDLPVRRQRKAMRDAEGRRLCVNCRQPITKVGNRWNNCIPCGRRYSAEHKRGVPRGTYVALWERQRGKCLCCHRKLRDMTERSPHIDHCHRTGAIRGLLCHYCNTALGIIHESEDHALALAEYISRHCEPLKREHHSSV